MASVIAGEDDPVNRFHGCTDNSTGCFEESRFESGSKIEPEYRCKVGLGVLNNPKTVPCCKNVFCHHCIMRCRPHRYNDDDNLAQQETQPTLYDSYDYDTLKCPLCREEFRVNELTDVCLPLKNLLNKFRIKCSFEQCKKVVTLDNIFYHEYECTYNPEREITCPDCNNKLRYSTFKKHYCKERVLRKFDDLENKTKRVKQELDKQKRMLERLLE